MSLEAMKQALDALEQHGTPLLNHEDAYSASLNALRQAIEEAEKQEPDELTIAYMSGFHDGKNKNAPQPKPLTDEEIFEIHKQVDSMQYLTFARAIEVAHGIKGE
jgi:imidazolonepropionase-like amidohydrolase